MIPAVALAWAAWWIWIGWARRPRPAAAGLALDDVWHGPGTVERWGLVAQRRVPVLDELPATAVGAVLAAAAVSAALAPSTAVLVGLALVTVARVRSISRLRAEARLAVAQAPSVVDLLALCLDAGLTPRLAVERVAPLVAAPLGPDLALAASRCARGEALSDALGSMADRGHPLRPAVLAVIGAERSGAPLAGALDRVAGEARAAVRRSTEERARRLPVAMLLPLVCCVLPAFGLVAIVPLVLGRLGDLL